MALITGKLGGEGGHPVLVQLERMPDEMLRVRVRDEQKRESIIIELLFDPLDAAGMLAELSTELTGSIFGTSS